MFVRYVSHEIRTPLNITILGLKYLEEELKKENKEALSSVQDVLDDVKCSCTIAVDILNDLLLYEKLDDGIFTLSLSLIAMIDFFREAINVFKVQAKSSEIELTVSTKGLDGVMVKIDRTKFSQVLRNIVSNALKFTPRNGKVSVSCHTLCSTTNDHGVIFAESSIPSNTTDTTNAPSMEVNRHCFNPEECIRIDSGFVRINVTDTGPGISKVCYLRIFVAMILFVIILFRYNRMISIIFFMNLPNSKQINCRMVKAPDWDCGVSSCIFF